MNEGFSPLPMRPGAPALDLECSPSPSAALYHHPKVGETAAAQSPIPMSQHQFLHHAGTPQSPGVASPTTTASRGLGRLKNYRLSTRSTSSYEGSSSAPGLSPENAVTSTTSLSPEAVVVTAGMDQFVSPTRFQQNYANNDLLSNGGAATFSGQQNMNHQQQQGCIETPRTTLRARVTRDKVLNAAVVMSSPGTSSSSKSSREDCEGNSCEKALLGKSLNSDNSLLDNNHHSSPPPPPHLTRKETASFVTPLRSQLGVLGGGQRLGNGNMQQPLSEYNPNVFGSSAVPSSCCPSAGSAARSSSLAASCFLTTVDIPSAVKTEVLEPPAILGGGDSLPQVLGVISPNRILSAQQEANAAVARSILLASPPHRVYGNGRVTSSPMGGAGASPSSLSKQQQNQQNQLQQQVVQVSPEHMTTMEGDSTSLLKRRHIQRMVQVNFDHPGALMQQQQQQHLNRISCSASTAASNALSPKGPSVENATTAVTFKPRPPPRRK